MRNPFAGNKTEVNGQTAAPPVVPAQSRMVRREPQLPMTLPEQLHPTTHALHQLDVALQENRRLMGNIEGLEVIIDDLRHQLKEALRDRAMYRGYTIEIRTHLGYLMDSAKQAHSCAMEAAERATVEPERETPPQPQDLDEAAEREDKLRDEIMQNLEEQLRGATAEMKTETEKPAPEVKV